MLFHITCNSAGGIQVKSKKKWEVGARTMAVEQVHVEGGRPFHTGR